MEHKDLSCNRRIGGKEDRRHVGGGGGANSPLGPPREELGPPQIDTVPNFIFGL